MTCGVHREEEWVGLRGLGYARAPLLAEDPDATRYRREYPRRGERCTMSQKEDLLNAILTPPQLERLCREFDLRIDDLEPNFVGWTKHVSLAAARPITRDDG